MCWQDSIWQSWMNMVTEFSEASLDLAGKLIAQNSKSAKTARALLQLVQIRNDSGDHASYLRLASPLRDQELFNEAISEYARLDLLCHKVLAVLTRQFWTYGRFIVTLNCMKHTPSLRHGTKIRSCRWQDVQYCFANY